MQKEWVNRRLGIDFSRMADDLVIRPTRAANFSMFDAGDASQREAERQIIDAVTRSFDRMVGMLPQEK